MRTETFILIPFFGLAFLLKRKFKAIPFLFLGFVLYSIVGYFYYHDLLWVFNKNPYSGASDIYGHGELLDFVKQNKSIWGNPASILIVIGLSAFVVVELIKRRSSASIYELLIIIFPAIAHLAAHSFLWWKGLGGSLGLTRVITCVLPFYAIMALRGFNFADSLIKKI